MLPALPKEGFHFSAVQTEKSGLSKIVKAVTGQTLSGPVLVSLRTPSCCIAVLRAFLSACWTAASVSRRTAGDKAVTGSRQKKLFSDASIYAILTQLDSDFGDVDLWNCAI